MIQATPFNHAIVAAFIATSQCHAFDKIHEFTKINKANTVVVKYFEQGCFGYYGYHFEFQFGNAPNVKITKRDPVFSQKIKRWVDRKSNHPSCIIPLSNEDLSAMDTLLYLYRSASKPTSDGLLHFSTSTEIVEFIEFSNSKPIAKEKFENHTGNTNPNPKPEGFISFNDLIQRAGIQ